MKKSLCIIIAAAIAVAVISCLAAYLIEEQNSSSSKGNTTKPEVQIEDFQWTSQQLLGNNWYTIGGVEAGKAFNLTIHNLSAQEKDNLTVQITVFDVNNSLVETGTWFEGGIVVCTNNVCLMGNLSANESRTFTGAITTDWGKLGRAADPLKAHVILKIEDATLYELEIEVPQ